MFLKDDGYYIAYKPYHSSMYLLNISWNKIYLLYNFYNEAHEQV